MGGPDRVLTIAALIAIGCSGKPVSTVASSTPKGEAMPSSCARAMSAATAQVERGELRAALATLAKLQESDGMAAPAPCSEATALGQRVRMELQLEIPLEPASPQAARESRQLHHAALDLLADGKHDEAIVQLEQAHGKWPHPSILAAIAKAHSLANRGKQARIAADRALSLANRIGGSATVELLRGHTQAIEHVAYDRTGRWLVTASGKELVVWDHASGQPIARLDDDQTTITAIAYLEDTLLAASEDGALRWWDIHRAQLLAKREDASGIRALAVTPDGGWFAVVNGTGLRVEQSGSGKVLWSADGDVARVAFADGGDTLVSAGLEPGRRSRVVVTVRTNGPSTRIQKKLVVPVKVGEDLTATDAVKDLAVSPDGKLVAVVAMEELFVFDRASGRKLANLETHDVPLYAAFHDNGKLEANEDLFDARTGKKLGSVSRCLLHPVERPGGGERACPASVHASMRARSLRLTASDGGERMLGHDDAHHTPSTISISPDGRALAVGHGKQAFAVDLATGNVLGLPMGTAANGVSITNDRRVAVAAGKRLVVFGPDAAKLYEQDFTDTVTAVAFRPDGKRLAVTHEAHVILYDTTPWKERKRIKAGYMMVILQWSSDGKRLFWHDSPSKDVIMWDVDLATAPKTVSTSGGGVGISLDGKHVAVVQMGRPKLVDVTTDPPTEKELQRPQGGTGGNDMTLAVAPDGKSILAGASEAIWIYSGGPAASIAMPGIPDEIDIHPAGKLAVIGNAQRHVIALDLATRTPVLSMTFAEGGRWAAFDSKNRVDGDDMLSGLVLRIGTIQLPAWLDSARRVRGVVAEAIK